VFYEALGGVWDLSLTFTNGFYSLVKIPLRIRRNISY